MLSNVKKRCAADCHQPGGHCFHRRYIKSLPHQTAQAADSIFNGVTRLLGSTVQVLVLLALGLVLYLATSKYGNIRLGEGKVEYSTPLMAVYVYLRRARLLHAVLGRCRMGLLLPDPGPEHCPAIAESAGIQHPLFFLPLGS